MLPLLFTASSYSFPKLECSPGSASIHAYQLIRSPESVSHPRPSLYYSIFLSIIRVQAYKDNTNGIETVDQSQKIVSAAEKFRIGTTCTSGVNFFKFSGEIQFRRGTETTLEFWAKLNS